jgi:hypothetical protein
MAGYGTLKWRHVPDFNDRLTMLIDTILDDDRCLLVCAPSPMACE